MISESHLFTVRLVDPMSFIDFLFLHKSDSGIVYLGYLLGEIFWW
ncbi:hypothetical protein [Aliivibrio salmonicida]